jgi:hypothetical protein
MGASSMCGLASGSLGASLWPLHLYASRAEQLAAQSQALGSRVLRALVVVVVVRGACCGSRPLRKRSSRVSRSTGRRFQAMVGASRRLNSQQLSAAMEGSARPARVARSKYSAKKNAGPSRLARSVAVPGVTPNPSIERTRPGKPGRASHVKRWASRKE